MKRGEKHERREMRHASRTKSEGTVRKGSAEIEIEIEVDAGALAWLTQAATTPTGELEAGTRGEYRYEMQWYLPGDAGAVTRGCQGPAWGHHSGLGCKGRYCRERYLYLANRDGVGRRTQHMPAEVPTEEYAAGCGQILAVVWPGICPC